MALQTPENEVKELTSIHISFQESLIYIGNGNNNKGKHIGIKKMIKGKSKRERTTGEKVPRLKSLM